MRKILCTTLSVLFLSGCGILPKTTPAPTEPVALPTDWRTYLYDWADEQGLLASKATPCEDELPIEGAKEFSLNESTSLFETVCFLAAYQPVYAYFLVTKSDPLQIQLVNFYREDLPDAPWETIAGLTDFANGKLNVSYKGRGLGDCGEQSVFSFEGAQFVLERLQEKECGSSFPQDENIVIDPSSWPVTYQRK